MSEENRRQERRERRREERRQFFSRSSIFALGFALSLAGALYVAWMVYPLTETAASPAVLREPFKEDFIYMVSQAYGQDNDWPAAEARLGQLNDPDIANTTLVMLENALREGRSPDAIRNLARLAEQLGAEGDTLALFAPTPVLASEPTAVPPTVTPAQPIATPTLAQTDETETSDSTETEDTAVIDTALPTNTLSAETQQITPTVTSEPELLLESYRLLSQREVCQAELDQPRIEVIVVNPALTEIRGIEVLLTSDQRTDRALTGFKSGGSAGYADFTIEPGQSYEITMGDGSGSVGGIQSGRCDNEDGPTGWILRYQSLVSE